MIRPEYSFVGTMSKPSPVRHYRGLPPELTGGVDLREDMPAAQVVVIEEKKSGIFLYRLDANGADCGDTWHLSVEEAKHQARFEYGDALSTWRVMPDDVADAREFAVQQLSDD